MPQTLFGKRVGPKLVKEGKRIRSKPIKEGKRIRFDRARFPERVRVSDSLELRRAFFVAETGLFKHLPLKRVFPVPYTVLKQGLKVDTVEIGTKRPYGVALGVNADGFGVRIGERQTLLRAFSLAKKVVRIKWGPGG